MPMYNGMQADLYCVPGILVLGVCGSHIVDFIFEVGRLCTAEFINDCTYIVLGSSMYATTRIGGRIVNGPTHLIQK